MFLRLFLLATSRLVCFDCYFVKYGLTSHCLQQCESMSSCNPAALRFDHRSSFGGEGLALIFDFFMSPSVFSFSSVVYSVLVLVHSATKSLLYFSISPRPSAGEYSAVQAVQPRSSILLIEHTGKSHLEIRFVSVSGYLSLAFSHHNTITRE